MPQAAAVLRTILRSPDVLVPPAAAFRICSPRQTARTGLPSSAAQRTNASSVRSRAGSVPARVAESATTYEAYR